jgi:hypothetical protein
MDSRLRTNVASGKLIIYQYKCVEKVRPTLALCRIEKRRKSMDDGYYYYDDN